MNSEAMFQFEFVFMAHPTKKSTVSSPNITQTHHGCGPLRKRVKKK
jgi:hypothetical protein